MTSGDVEADPFTAKLSPSSVLDEVWHLMMLRPRLYASVCRSLGASEPIDHDPRLALPFAGHGTRLKETIKLYTRVYGVRPPHIWREAALDEEVPRRPSKRARAEGAAAAAPRDGCGPPLLVRLDELPTLHLVLKLGGC